MKALVIGGTDPAGPLVVEGLLKRGYEVTIFHRGIHEVEFPKSVEHLHGEVHFVEPLKETFGKRNFDLVIGMYGRLRYVAEVIKDKTPRFIAMGGLPYKAMVEGEKFPGGVPLFIREDAPLFRDKGKNKFTYLITSSEEAVMGAHQEGCYVATILRVPMIYGPRQLAPREWSIIRRILDDRRYLIIPDGGLKLERRGYTENVAHAVLLVVDEPQASAGKIFNIGDETVLSLKNWVEIIANALNHEWELISIPFSLARPSRPYAGRAFHWITDIEKIKNEIGYRDLISPHEGIEQTVKWYMENQPPRGGEEERQLGDPFDYTTEDALINDYKRATITIREKASIGYKYRHPYPHPKEENDRI